MSDTILCPRQAPQLLSIVCPCFNEEAVLEEFVRRVSAVMSSAGQRTELVLINDGSSDHTLVKMLSLAAARDDISVVNLTRNFGKEIALTAGLAHAAGDAVVVIDSDLQDPPEVIPQFIERYCEGYDIAYGRRVDRQSDSWRKRFTAGLFYRLMRNVGPVALPENVGDYRLMSRRAVDALLTLPEQHRFMKGLFAWIGFPSIGVDYARPQRFAGKSKWNFRKLLDLSIEGVTSFTTVPLRLSIYMGFAIAFLAFLRALGYLVGVIIYGDQVQGFPTLYLTVLLLGGAQLVALGVIGEYLGRVFNETKRRPLFLVESVKWSKAGSASRRLADLDPQRQRAPETK